MMIGMTGRFVWEKVVFKAHSEPGTEIRLLPTNLHQLLLDLVTL